LDYRIIYLATAHAVTTIQAFIAGAAADRDMAAGVTGGSIALHAPGGCV